MTQSDPAGMHDWHSSAYVQSWIDAYRDEERVASLRRIANLIPFDPEAPIRVLDIGGGWGPVTRVVLDTFPNAHVVLHDFSEPMLAEARGYLEEYGDTVTYVRSDLLRPDWAAGVGGPFDAVVSCIAIHNVRFPDRVAGIYQEIFPLVAAGGCFINLDHVAAGELIRRASRHAQQMEQRQRLFEETGRWTPLSEITLPSGMGRRPDAHAQPSAEDLKRIASHEPATLANQLRWLLEAGFDEVECFARDRAGVLIGAFRAAG